MTHMRAKFVAQNVVRRSDGSPAPFIGLESIQSGTGRVVSEDLPTKRAEDSLLHCQGDVLFGKLRPYLAKSVLVQRSGTGTGELLVLRPNQVRVDSRFLCYTTLSRPWMEWAEMSSYGTKMPRTSWEAMAEYRMWIPSLDEQRRIADFLDAETARLDQLIDLQNEVKVRLREREDSYIEAQFVTSRMKWRPLAALTDTSRPIMYGIVLPGPHVSGGVPIVKGGDVAANRLHPDLLSRTSPEIEARFVRSRLRGGDLVFAIRGSVGEVSAVPDSLTGANLTQDAARISVSKTTDRRWLEIVLRAPSVRRQVEERVTGATIRGINIWDLKRVLVPTPLPEEQTELAVAATEIIDSNRDLNRTIDTQLRLLAERRQALITAAVTGQFDVTTARGVDVS